MSYVCLIIGTVIIFASLFFAVKKRHNTKAWISVVTFGVLLSVFFMVLPTEWSKSEDALIKPLYNIISALLYSFKVIGGRQDISQLDKIGFTGIIRYIYVLINYAAFIAVPVLGSSLVLSFVGDSLSKLRYMIPTTKTVYVFSELNENSLILAKGINSKNKIVFCNTKKTDEDLIEKAKKIHAMTLHKSCDSVRIKKWAKKYEICLVSENEAKNIELTKKLINKLKEHKGKTVNITSFAKKGPHIQLIESIVKSTVSGTRFPVNVRFIDKTTLFCNNLIFKNPLYNTVNNSKDISVMIIGCGKTGMSMLKTVAWYGQIDGYTLKIKVYDKEAEHIKKKFNAECPELNKKYGYQIEFIETDIETEDFTKAITDNKQAEDATVAYVFTGNDELNLKASETLLSVFRKNRDFCNTPPIFTWVNDKTKFNVFAQSENNYLTQRNIHLVGNIENLFDDKTFFNSKLENLALAVNLCYKGILDVPASDEEFKEAVNAFRNSAYDRESSMAAALHITAKLHACNILKADEWELTNEKACKFEDYLRNNEKEILRLAQNEHNRWNAYMRSEGYTSADTQVAKKYAKINDSHKDEFSKTHPCLTDWDGLNEICDFCKSELNTNKPFQEYDKDIIKAIPKIIITANSFTKEDLLCIHLNQ